MTEELRQVFYDRLAKDYKNEEERSFLYQYFVKNPPKRRGGAGERDIRRDIQTFLYDAQHGRKADRSLALFLGYCESQGIDPFSGGGGNVPDPDEVDALYHDLRNGDDNEVLLPVYIDPVTGAGLYIIGTDHLGTLASQVEGTCCYGLFSPNFLELDTDEDANWCTWPLWSGKRAEALERLCIPCAAEGLKWLRRTESAKALDYFASYNVICPPSCPTALRRYFSAAEPQEQEDLVAYGRQRFLEESGQS